MKAHNHKGFIGAIGDDFPSLIPLFFAIMLFFSTLGYAFTTINERNDYINTYIDSLKIAKTALGKGMFSNYDDFMNTQKQIITTSNYVVGLVYLDKNVLEEREELDYFDTDIYVKGDNKCVILYGDESKNKIENRDYKIGDCENDDELNTFLAYSSSAENLLDDVSFTEFAKSKRIYSYVYPVGLATEKGTVQVYLIVLVW